MAEEFVEEFGEDELKIVTKTHFKLTEKLGLFSNESIYQIRRPKTPKLIPKALSLATIKPLPSNSG